MKIDIYSSITKKTFINTLITSFILYLYFTGQRNFRFVRESKSSLRRKEGEKKENCCKKSYDKPRLERGDVF